LVSRILSEFIVDFDLEKIKSKIDFDYVKKLIADAVACGIAGSRGSCADVVIETIGNLSNLPQSSIIGNHHKTSAQYAAFINSFLARNYSFDDTYEAGVIHSGAAVVMSSFALGEWLNSTIDESITAMITGYEVAARVAGAVNPAHFDKGFHPTGTCNAIGVAALASKLLRLDTNETSTALRIAADAACGLRQYQIDGNMVAGAFHAAKAAENGITAALLAKGGFLDPGDTLGGKFGLFHCMANGGDEQKLLTGLGTKFQFLETSLKPYPSCRYMHGAVDAVAKCKHQNQLAMEDIAGINIYTFKVALEEGNRAQPESALDAKFSIHYNVATYLLKGAIGIGDFTPEAIKDQKVSQWCRKIKVYEDKDLTKQYPEQWPFRAEVVTQGGRVFTHQSPYPPGSPDNPLGAEEFQRKCLSLVKPIVGEEKGRTLLLKLENIEDFLTVDNFISYLNRACGVKR
jgi:2-methylcitrate dehydratase PrpD